jgi:hypothetical protein
VARKPIASLVSAQKWRRNVCHLYPLPVCAFLLTLGTSWHGPLPQLPRGTHAERSAAYPNTHACANASVAANAHTHACAATNRQGKAQADTAGRASGNRCEQSRNQQATGEQIRKTHRRRPQTHIRQSTEETGARQLVPHWVRPTRSRSGCRLCGKASPSFRFAHGKSPACPLCAWPARPRGRAG